MRHLDLQVNDLVDDRLDDDHRDLALAHLADCEHCRRLAEDLRVVKGALGALGAVEPRASFLGRLTGIAGPDGPLPVDHDALPAGMVSVAQWRPRDTRPDGRGPGSSGPGWASRHRRGVRVAAAGVVSAGAMVALLASLGATTGTELPGGVTPATVVPAVDRYMQEHARTTGTLPFVDPASYLSPTSGGGQ